MKKEEKIRLTPKPIGDLIDPEKTNLLAANTTFVQAFKNQQQENLKNASSWSQLASVDPSQNPSMSQNKPKVPLPSTETFQAYRNKAKEKMDRQKLLEQQEMKRVQKEQAEKEQLKRQQQEQQKIKQDEINNGR